MPVNPFKVDIDTTQLSFNPNNDDFVVKISEAIPAFEDFNRKQTLRLAERRRIYSWIVCMYDINSPLRKEIKDLYKRKVHAGKLAGLVPLRLSGKYKKFIENIFVGQDEEINKLIVKFIAYFASPEYMQLIGTEALQHNVLESIISGDVSKQNNDLLDNTTEKIKKLVNFLYGTGERDEVYEARRALYKQVSYDLSDMRPENVAKLMEVDGSLPESWNPYEQGYVPEEIKFAGDNPEITGEDERDL